MLGNLQNLDVSCMLWYQVSAQKCSAASVIALKPQLCTEPLLSFENYNIFLLSLLSYSHLLPLVMQI